MFNETEQHKCVMQGIIKSVLMHFVYHRITFME